jgi:arsenate reductase-like glutaredoxin family protein
VQQYIAFYKNGIIKIELNSKELTSLVIISMKIYTLSTCDTSRRIIKPISKNGFEIKDIKKEAITSLELEELKTFSGSYESLFSRRSRSYIAMGLKDKELHEQDYKELILKDYTFLKRPVIVIDREIFIGNQKKNVAALYAKLGINE